MGDPSSRTSQSRCWDTSSSRLAEECALAVSLRTERNLSPMSPYKRTGPTHGPITAPQTPCSNTIRPRIASDLQDINGGLTNIQSTWGDFLWVFHHLTYLPTHRKVHSHNSHRNNQFKVRSGMIAHACGLSTQYIRIFTSSRMAWAM